MLKFLELYHEMEKTHPDNMKMVAVSTSRVFLEKIMMPWLEQCGIQVTEEEDEKESCSQVIYLFQGLSFCW